MRLLNKLSRGFDRTIAILSVMAGVLLVFVTLLIGAEIFARYFFRAPITGADEIAAYSLVFMTFLPAAWLLQKDAHVKMDFLATRLNPFSRNLINAITSFLAVLTFLVLTYYGAWVTRDHFIRGVHLYTVLNTPTFILLFIIPVGSFLLFIQSIRRTYGFIRDLRTSTKKQSHRGPEALALEG